MIVVMVNVWAFASAPVLKFAVADGGALARWARAGQTLPNNFATWEPNR